MEKKIVYYWIFDFVDRFNNEVYKNGCLINIYEKYSISLFLESLKYWFKKINLVIIFDECFFS